MLTYVFGVVLLFAVIVAADKRCVSLFDTAPNEFDICKTTECIIFRTEIPFVWIPKVMNSTEHQKPFPCSKYKETFENLRGPFFEIVQALDPLRDAQCVWGGSTCQFDDMIQFVGRTSQSKPHKFIAGGLLFMLRYRLSTATIASASLLDNQLIVIGPRDEEGTTWATAWATIWRPFSRKAWVLIFLSILTVLFMRLWISFHFTVPWSWHQFRDNVLGDYGHSREKSRRVSARVARFRDPDELRRLNMYITNFFKIFFVIVILYFEISIVNHIFAKRSETMDKIYPKQFVVTGNTTMSRMFNNYIKGQQFSGCSDSNIPCWKEVERIENVYNTIVSWNTSHQYTAVYETLNRYWFKENSSLCKKLQVLEYPPLNRRFSGVWYYSSAINRTRRSVIDQAIVSLREQDKIRGLVHAVTGSKLPSNCENADNIDFLQLGMPLLLFAGPIFSVVFFYMMLYTIRWFNRDRKEYERDDVYAEEFDDERLSYQKSGVRDNSLSQLSICTTANNAELLGRLLERFQFDTQIRRLP